MKITYKIASILLAGIFLISSLGFTISSMVCIKSGKGKVSLSVIEDCCAKKPSQDVSKEICCDDDQAVIVPKGVTVIKKGECCDINSYSFHLNDFQSAKKLALNQPTVFQTLFSVLTIDAISAGESKLSFQYSDLPPPLYGRTLLNFISLLTI